ncbi:hypothetical protein FRACYDRAFT_233819 [Fragilariopsis cylindrus CCMP1102]|uniref:Uncharacterized protein n=1 Tax=Fragilariopsis cylindrus CCMP1102 TaxID=635003 RepID=A0A1E7FZS2_9STRA|nr:hypothetical protein FRACYDRAFT_233819 [Fragilariopsis cylindrus CCMP1102]|eukprot:OEU23647.1 hypothetical protein FRACYDRAFT_233819 [Fragilariopsis cylindrus CCMP1102]
MGNCQQKQTQTQTQSKNGGENDDDNVKQDSNNHFTPPSNTLTSLKADKEKGYSFSIPKNACFNGSSGESCSISSSGDDMEFGDRKFVPVDSTRCLLTHKGKTEAILIRNDHTQTIQICSFTPPGNELGNGHPLFEWGVIGKTNIRTRCNGYTMTTAINNGSSYSVRGVLVASSTSSQQQISNVHNNNNNNNNNKMVVTTLNSDGENKTCATFFEGIDDTWECHTMSGIDPVMMVCFIVALDTLRTMNKQRNGSIINFGSATHRRMILSRGGSSSSSRTRSVKTSRTASLLTSNTSTLNNSSGQSAFGKMLEKSSSSKRNSIGSCSGASCLQQQDMPRRTSFINNARAA